MLLLAPVLGACEAPPPPAPPPTAPPPGAPPAAAPQPSPTPDPTGPAAQGRQLYNVLCSGCHGPQGQGTDFAPSLPGHSAAVVRRQVRSPIGTMPPFSPPRLGEQDLELIVDHILSMPVPERHAEPVNMQDELGMHHWMAIYGLEAGDLEDALHHVNHILGMVADDAEHLRRMDGIAENIRQGEYHEAEHEMQEMLAGKAYPDLSMLKLHLNLALIDLDLRNEQDTLHHLEHIIELDLEPISRQAREAAESIRVGDLHGAEHGLEDMARAAG